MWLLPRPYIPVTRGLAHHVAELLAACSACHGVRYAAKHHDDDEERHYSDSAVMPPSGIFHAHLFKPIRGGGQEGHFFGGALAFVKLDANLLGVSRGGFDGTSSAAHGCGFGSV